MSEWPVLLMSPKCPKCGCKVLLNERGEVMCTYIGGIHGCDYQGTIKFESVEVEPENTEDKTCTCPTLTYKRHPLNCDFCPIHGRDRF